MLQTYSKQIREFAFGEGDNSVPHYYLARLHRKTKSFSNFSQMMLELSIAFIIQSRELFCSSIYKFPTFVELDPTGKFCYTDAMVRFSDLVWCSVKLLFSFLFVFAFQLARTL